MPRFNKYQPAPIIKKPVITIGSRVICPVATRCGCIKCHHKFEHKYDTDCHEVENYCPTCIEKSQYFNQLVKGGKGK